MKTRGYVLLVAVIASLISSATWLAPWANSATRKRLAASSYALPPGSPGQIVVGSFKLVHCPGLSAYCGTLVRPLDPAGQVPDTITIGFQWYPHSDSSQPGLGTIVADEGGPGYATTGSATSYLALFMPLLDHRDLLLMDNRGTGASEAIDCEPLQSQPHPTFQSVAQCGATLGPTSDLYGSGLAADDLAAILDGLGIETVDLYGDSYGTFFSQTFAGRHPDRLRSLVLDSAYPVMGESPFYPEAGPAMRNAFESVCQQSVTCRDLPGDTLARITRLLDSLRAHPFNGLAYNGDGNLVPVTADATNLAYLAFSNSTTSVVYRELDAAARAYLEDGDSLPMLRLFAENDFISISDYPPYNLPAQSSQGLFVAVSCQDYPQLYEMTSSTPARIPQRNASFANAQATEPGIFSPFTIAEVNSEPLDYSVFDLCLTWPVPSPLHPPGQPVPPGAQFTSAPVLVLTGTLDSLTPAEQGQKAAGLFPHADHILVDNSFHVTAEGDQDDCASKIVVNFVEFLDPGDTACTTQIANVRTVPKFTGSAAQVAPATPLPGNQGTLADLRVAAAAAATAGDVVARWWDNLSGSGVGLRGGSFRYTSSGPGYVFVLNNLLWVNDVSVSGTLSWDYYKPGTAIAHLFVSGPATEAGTLDITWYDRVYQATANISGTIGGRAIAATMPAP